MVRTLVMVMVTVTALVIASCGGKPPGPPVSPGPPGEDSGSGPPPPGEGSGSASPPAPAPPQISWRRVETAADLPPPPGPGSYRVHMIDVGTGLAILIHGADFALLYDGGTNDRDERPARVVGYLAAALGASGDDLCTVDGAPAPTQLARRRLPHIVLSHPHLDHASALDLVVHCYEVGAFWDSGRVNDTVFYRELLSAVGASAATQYHTAASVPADHTVQVKGAAIQLPRWQRFSEGDRIELGARASFTILHAEPKQLPDPNQNSLVIAVELGGARLLLVGDAESGERRDPSEPPGDIEQFLLDHHRDALRADVLQVGHHGSKTSSRRAFVAAVAPRLALVSSGPKQYRGTTLPDREVLDELARVGAHVLRSDERDAGCPVRGRIGGDRGPGGCDSWVVLIEPAAAPAP